MKKMYRMLSVCLVAVMTVFAMAACGNDGTPATTEEPVEYVSADAIGLPTGTSTGQTDPATTETVETEVLPDGYVRSSLTNELVTEEVANTRPIAVMIPMDKVAQPDYGNSRAGVVYECLVEGSITRTMNIIEDWEDMDKIGNIRSTRDYFIFWSWEWDAILLHDGGPVAYITDPINNVLTNNISGLGYRDNSRSAPHNEYYTADIVNSNIESKNYSKEHRDCFVPDHFNFVPNGGQQDLAAVYGSQAVAAYIVDLKNCYPVTQSRFEYNPEDGLYYRFIYNEPHMDNADPDNPVQLSFSNIILQRCIGCSRDDHDYRAFEVHKTTEDGWFITNGMAIHITWQKTDNGPTRYYDDAGNEIQLSTGKTIICIIQDGGSASTDFIFLDEDGNEVAAEFNN